MKQGPVDHVDAAAAWLVVLGERLHATRASLKVSVTSAAQAAGVSRVTWHRMEAGSPSVSAGAYAKALDVLGIADVESGERTTARESGTIPTRIRVADWPELSALAWSLRPDAVLTPREALDLYERNSRHLDRARLTDAERALIDDLREGLADGVRA